MSFLKSILGTMMSGHGSNRSGGHHGGGYGPYSGNLPSSGAPSGPTCPNCGAANSVGTRFCGQCGTSLAIAKCASCKAELGVGVKFCAQCGNPRL